MELKEAIFERRSVRQYQERAVERELLKEIILAGIWSPTAGNIQPWVFFCITDPKRLHLIQIVSPGMLGNPQALICICSDQKRAFDKSGKGGKILALFDCAMAAQNIMLRAYDLGLGTCAVRSFNQVAVRELLEAPEYLQPEVLITLGHPSHKPVKPKRNQNVIFWERYEMREDRHD